MSQLPEPRDDSREMRALSGTVLSAKLHQLVAHEDARNNKVSLAMVSDVEMGLNFDKSPFLSNEINEVGIEIRAQDVDVLLPRLEEAGLKVSGVQKRYRIIEGFMPIDKILALDELKNSGLLSADLTYAPIMHTGSVTSQADEKLRTAEIRANYPMRDGRGVKVGAMSDSYDNLGGEAAGIASGDLPNDVVVIQDLPAGGSDEGRALCELIHDLAPGADLYSATAGLGQVSFADNIQTLADSGCTVIVDDVSYFAEPFFQDGIIAQKVDEVVTTQNVLYFSAAGNMSDNSYESTDINVVSPSVSGFGGLGDYDFDTTPGGEDVFQKITLEEGQQIALSLQWDDPFFTADQVDTDLDLFLFDDPPVNVIADSRNDNILNQTPVEILIHTNPGPGVQTLNVLISKAAGPDPGRIKYLNFAAHNPQEFDTNSPTIVGHAAAKKAFAVAAAFFGGNTVEPFSSIGPSTILFQPDGTPNTIASGEEKAFFDDPVSEVRPKPDITAPDGTNNTFFGADIPFDDDLFPNFFGTSAAAPHSAAVAAMLLSTLPGGDFDDYFSILTQLAEDIDITGFDSRSGHGGTNPIIMGIQQDPPDNIIFADGFESGNTSAWTDQVPRPGFLASNNQKAGGPNSDIRTIMAINRISSDRQEPIDLIFKSGNTLDLRPNFEVANGLIFELHVIDLDFLNEH